MQRRYFQGPSMCIIFLVYEENINHRAMEYDYSKQLQWDVKQNIRLQNTWYVESIEDYLKHLFQRRELKCFRDLPFFMLWGIWIDTMPYY
jgi:hypothetical protein